MTDLTPQQRRKTQTHQQIIQEALQLIFAHGLRGLSFRELADAPDYTPVPCTATLTARMTSSMRFERHVFSV
jgi:DNA-binding transcriptional regulator YbjK